MRRNAAPAGLTLAADLVAASATAATAWTALDGFPVHRPGTLAWDGPADALRLAVRRMRVWLCGGGFASSIHVHKEASPSG
ncbi:hypothetical protein ACPPVO_31665 [Dactylosporangium sp. McL0621]|uniref:hypothetical protein n=1 Tax=Dactylosporangium sp. McL0621 TaxID=3415678 RepID=UPI003CEC7AFA